MPVVPAAFAIRHVVSTVFADRRVVLLARRAPGGVVAVVGSYFAGAVIGSAFLFLLMLGVLLVRPRGLLGAGVRI